jgi:hypothetical protein
VEIESITIAAESRRSYPIAIDDINCFMTIIIDQEWYLRDQLLFKEDGGKTLDNENDWIGWHVVGTFLVDYTLAEPVVIDPFGHAVLRGIEAKMSISASPTDSGIRLVNSADQRPSAGCWVMGASARNGNQAGGAILKQQDLIGLNPLELLSRSELVETTSAEAFRQKLISEVEEIQKNYNGPKRIKASPQN